MDLFQSVADVDNRRSTDKIDGVVIIAAPFRRVVLGSRMMGVRGQVQKEGLVVHVIAKEIFNMTPALVSIAGGYDLGDAAIANADEGKSGPRGSARGSSKIQDMEVERESMRRALPSGRNFH